MSNGDGYVLNEAVVATACALAAPTICAMAKAAPGSGPGAFVAVELPGTDDTTTICLEAFGDAARAARCEEIALAKLGTSMRTNMPSGHVHPALMSVEDTIYAGSAVYKGVHVAISGFKGWCDEGGATVIAVIISFICETIVTRIRESGATYVGQGLELRRAEVLKALNPT
jgi:hypothetical protein